MGILINSLMIREWLNIQFHFWTKLSVFQKSLFYRGDSGWNFLSKIHIAFPEIAEAGGFCELTPHDISFNFPELRIEILQDYDYKDKYLRNNSMNDLKMVLQKNLAINKITVKLLIHKFLILD